VPFFFFFFSFSFLFFFSFSFSFFFFFFLISPYFDQPKSKFWGKSMEITNEGVINVRLKPTGDHFSWSKVTTCMRNIFSDNRSLEHYGEMQIDNHTTGEYAKLTFKESSFFSAGNNEVSGFVYNAEGAKVYTLSGKWPEYLQYEVEGDRFKVPLLSFLFFFFFLFFSSFSWNFGW